MKMFRSALFLLVAIVGAALAGETPPRLTGPPHRHHHYHCTAAVTIATATLNKGSEGLRPSTEGRPSLRTTYLGQVIIDDRL